MKRCIFAAIVVAVALGLFITLGLWPAKRPLSSAKIYTPMTLQQAELQHRIVLHPGMTFQIRGTLKGPYQVHIGAANEVVYTLLDDTSSGGLLVGGGMVNEFIATVRRIPLLGGLLPVSDAPPPMSQPATYHVEFVGCTAHPVCMGQMWQFQSSS